MLDNISFSHDDVAATALEWARVSKLMAYFFNYKVSHYFFEITVADYALNSDAGLAEGMAGKAQRGGTSQQVVADWAIQGTVILV